MISGLVKLFGLLALTAVLPGSDPELMPGRGTGLVPPHGRLVGTLKLSGCVAPTTLAIVGDFGAHTPGQRGVAAMLQSWQPDAVLTVGDNNYLSPGLEEIFDAPAPGRPLNGWQVAVGAFFGEFIARRADGRFPELRSASPRLFPTVGNHDLIDAPGAAGRLEGYHEYFRLNPGGPSRLPDDREALHTGETSYYAVRLGPVDCFMLDSNPLVEFDEHAGALLAAQRQWFATQLTASDARWKIACFHHAPYSSGSYGGHARMQWPELSQVDAIFCGHDHLYERLIYHPDGADSGPLLIVTGHGGAKLYPFREISPQSRVRKAGVYGALWMRAHADTLLIESWATDPDTSHRTLIDSVRRGADATDDATDDYWFHAAAGTAIEAATIEAATAEDAAIESAPVDAAAEAGMPATGQAELTLELWSPEGTRAASGLPPLRHTLESSGRWRLRLTTNGHTPRPLNYSVQLGRPTDESFESWQERRFPKSPKSQSAATADPDRDGLDNATEFALGLDPRRRDAAAPGIRIIDGSEDLIEILAQPPHPPAPGVRLRLEEKARSPEGRRVDWLERLAFSPWQARAGIDAWEEVAGASPGEVVFRWQRVRDPLLAAPVFRWRAELIPTTDTP